MLSVSVLLCVAVCVYLCMYVVYTYLFLRVPTGNIFSALLRVGPGGVELWWPHLSWAAGSGNLEVNPADTARAYPQGAAAPHFWIWAETAVSQLSGRQAPKQNLCPLVTQSSGHGENIPPVALRAQILHLFP